MDHVLLVTVDSLRADHVGHHGYHRDTTPFLDELADSGSDFQRAFAHAGGTRFAFPSILTSVHPTMYGGYEQVTDDQTMISEVFRDGGYRTGGFHSNLYLSADFGYDRGWDRFYDSKPDPSAATRLRTRLKRLLSDTPLWPLATKTYNWLESSSGLNVGSFHVPADETTDMALEFVEDVSPTQPVFCWVHYMDPHHPFLPPAEYQRYFRDDPVDDRTSVKLRQKLIQEPEKVTDEALALQLDLYDAETRFWDDELRRLVERTREELGEVTVAVTADHGEHFLEHGYFSSAQLFDVKQHVPLVIEGGGWVDGGTYDDLVGLVDLPPTLVEHAGLPIPERYEGYPIQRLLAGDWPRTAVIGGHGDLDGPYGCRTGRWKFIWEAGQADRLFDLENDPEELENVAGDHPDVVSDLRERIEDHRDRVRRTEADVDVEMDEAVKERLRRLGYSE
jgi:arylsulfatase A-like enzyme